MKAIILAAGRGSRMKHLTDESPKCLLQIKGKPLLEWQLDALHEADIKEIAVVTGYKHEMLSKYDLVKFHNPNWSETQMVSSLYCASEWLEEEPCLVSYSDIFYDSTAVESLIESDEEISLTYDSNWLDLWTKRFGDPLLDAETFRIDNEGFLAEIGKKAMNIEEIEGQYMGLLKFNPGGWIKLKNIFNNLLIEEKNSIHMTGILQMLIELRKVKVKPVPYKREWGEFDSIQDLKLLSCKNQI